MNPFIPTAQDLLHNRGLLIAGKIYEFAEIEFYFYSPTHLDIYAHCHPEQKVYGKFYFHRASNREGVGYKGGTYKGLDITLGDGKDTYYGILIRALYNPEVGIITGPSKVVDHILSQYKVGSINELVGNGCLDLLNNHRDMKMVELKVKNTEKIYVGPRIGLNMNTSQEWVQKPYRFCIHYPLIKKDKRKLVCIN